jgi:signal transduction histidine kinase
MRARRTALRLGSVRSSPELLATGRTALRALPRAVVDIDVLLALAAFGALLADPLLLGRITALTPGIVALSLMAAIPLVGRRRYPLAVLAAEVPLLFACLAVAHPNRAAVGIAMLLVFTVGLEGGRTRSLAVGAVMALIVAVAVALTGRGDGPIDFVAYISVVLGSLLAGETLRARQALQRALAEEAVRAGEAAARHRFDSERLALAHELHDVVGHALVAVNVRAAAAARRARKGRPADGLAALDEIASVSAGALAELRATLKALRAAQDGPAPLHPVQDLGDLAGLIAGVREAGLSVELDVTGDVASLPPPVGHAGYRIVQEGLTNVLRHSTARQARVRVEAGDRALVIEVLDNGQPHAPAAVAAAARVAGHGLAGMRERAAALGGSCEAGPLDGAGWQVLAKIPLSEVGQAPGERAAAPGEATA